MMIFDDNILKFMDRGELLDSLEPVVALGFKEMHRNGAKIWSISDSANPKHWSDQVDVGIGLVSLGVTRYRAVRSISGNQFNINSFYM